MNRQRALFFPGVALCAVLLACTFRAAAQTAPASAGMPYIVKLKNGDGFRCAIAGYDDSTVALRSQFGTVTVRKDQISGFMYAEGISGKGPKHFLMPTAAPNGPGGFLDVYELGFLYGGVGLGYGATITGGVSLVPGIAFDKQIFHVNAKFTVLRDTSVEVAVGGAFTWLTARHPYSHIYGVVTSALGNGRVSTMLLYRVSGKQFAPVELSFFNSLDTTRFTINYNGSLGAAIGFDAPAFGRDDILWVAEFWNHDLTSARNTLGILGVRLQNEHLSADFGLMLLPAPFVFPVTRFGWKF